MNPQYILLTVVNVITPNQQRQGTANIAVINPPLRKLFPLPVEVNKEQGAADDRARAELQFGPVVVRVAELFEDVVDAIDKAGAENRTVVRVINRGAIQIASAQVALDNLPPGVVRWDEAMQTSGENTGAPAVGANVEHKPSNGDLRIIVGSDGAGMNWQVEARQLLKDDSWRWQRNLAPVELRASYSSRDAALSAIKAAGYIRRLVEGA